MTAELTLRDQRQDFAMRERELQYTTELRSFREECAVTVQRHEQQGALLQEFAGEAHRQNAGHREAAELALTQQRELASLRMTCETSLNQVHAECVAMRRRGETQREENISVGKFGRHSKSNSNGQFNGRRSRGVVRKPSKRMRTINF